MGEFMTVMIDCPLFVCVKEHGVLSQEMPASNMHAKLMTDPSMMTNMLKSQLTGTAPHLLMGFLVNQFFAGFIMGKVPFTLSPRFRTMLQRGIDMQSLDVSYFTSLSFYILLLFGLRGVLALIFSGDVIDETAVVSQSMRGASPTFDAKTEYKNEKQRYELVRRFPASSCTFMFCVHCENVLQ
jgi:ER membrane protein complex subunit 3